ncbi:YpbF family protein [Mesobacillus harenae]|uniref:YpbF family protein n=1 Tax=Mesobacillus harenae TaxID=2213203 RepID=UPI0015811738|nr:YpbF family protein [Mesobacillus harenae]
MEPSILMLDERTDQTAKKMLDNVVKRKRKFENLKSRHILVMCLTMAFAFFFFLYLFLTVVQPYSYSFAQMFTAFVSDSVNLYLLVIVVGTFGWMNLLREKREKAEKEYHALRCEIIDKSKDLWKKEDEWKSRHLVFELMNTKYDINLYHENK